MGLVGDPFVEDEVGDVTRLRPHLGRDLECRRGLVGEAPAGLVHEDRSHRDDRHRHRQLSGHGDERVHHAGAEPPHRGAGLLSESKGFARGARGTGIGQARHRGAVLTDEGVVAREAAAREQHASAERLTGAAALGAHRDAAHAALVPHQTLARHARPGGTHRRPAPMDHPAYCS